MQNECFVCGGNDFDIMDGAFVCNECGIQSQSMREECVNFTDNAMNVVHNDTADNDHTLTTGSQLQKETKLLSWECFNLIILGLTKEMIELGAKPSLKVIVLQLWVRYLQSIEAAFISKKSKKLPKLNSAIYNIDGEILYGVKNIKKKLIHSKTGIKFRSKTVRTRKKKSIKTNDSESVLSDSTNNTPNRRRTLHNRLRNLEKSSRKSNNDLTEISDDVSLLQRSKKSTKVKVKMTKVMKKTLVSMPSVVEENIPVDESSKRIQSGRKCWKKLQFKEKYNHISLKKIIAIIRLALMINDDDIFLSDILRWIHEGHFHVNRVNLFLPENIKHDIPLQCMAVITSRRQLNNDLLSLLNNFKADVLPCINLNKLITRFCDELQLPNDFKNFVFKLALIFPPKVRVVFLLPDIEVIVMSYILFAAKFLFGLDDYTENLSSHFAEKVNKSNKLKEKLFDWNEYVQYMECRSSVVSEYNYLLQSNLYENRLCNTKLFLNNWNIKKSTFNSEPSNLINKDLRFNTEMLLRSLPYASSRGNYREIPASTKPLSTTLKWLFEYHSMKLNVEAKNILENDFTQTNISYLTDEKRIHEIAETCDVPIVIDYNKPLHYVKRDSKLDKDTKRVINIKRSVQVFLRNSVANNEREKTPEYSHEENSNTIILGTGANYWCIYFNVEVLTRVYDAKANAVLKKQLPNSFFWFMKQCSLILDCRPVELYGELIGLEKKSSKFLASCDTDYSQTENGDTFSDITSNTIK